MVPMEEIPTEIWSVHIFSFLGVEVPERLRFGSNFGQAMQIEQLLFLRLSFTDPGCGTG